MGNEEADLLLVTPQGTRIVAFIKKKFPHVKPEQLYEKLDTFARSRKQQRQFGLNSPTAEVPTQWVKKWRKARNLYSQTNLPSRGEPVAVDEVVVVTKIRYHGGQEEAFSWWSGLSPKQRMDVIEGYHEQLKGDNE